MSFAMSTTTSHEQCIKNKTWCGKFCCTEETTSCPNQPKFTEDGRMCSRFAGSPDCIYQNSVCGPDCINYYPLMKNPNQVNCFIGEACRPWQENEGKGAYIPGINRDDYTEEEQIQIIDHIKSLEDAKGDALSAEAMLQAVLEFMPK